MSDEQQEAIKAWFGVCEEAARRLSEHQYVRWMFMVGTSGTDTERTIRGRAALDRIVTRERHLRDALVPFVRIDKP